MVDRAVIEALVRLRPNRDFQKFMNWLCEREEAAITRWGSSREFYDMASAQGARNELKEIRQVAFACEETMKSLAKTESPL